MLAGPLGAAGGGAAEGGVALHTLATAALQPAGGGAATTWTCDRSHSLQSAGLWIDNQWKKQQNMMMILHTPIPWSFFNI